MISYDQIIVSKTTLHFKYVSKEQTKQIKTNQEERDERRKLFIKLHIFYKKKLYKKMSIKIPIILRKY